MRTCEGQPTTRGIAAQEKVTQWIQAQVVLDYAYSNHLSVPSSVQDLSGAPGWDRMSTGQQKALQEFADAQEEMQGVAKANPDLAIDPAKLDIVINPRFDLDVSKDSFVPTDHQLSVAVSKAATDSAQQPTLEQLQALPSSQVCGKVPTGSAPAAG